MMKVNKTELRLGNLLLDREGRLCRVESISSEESMYEEDCGFDAPAIVGGTTALPNKPIPITEEWIKKLGLSQKKMGKFKEVSSRVIISVYYEKNGFFLDQRPELKYVHQLQNLYFVLTGKELKCKQN